MKSDDVASNIVSTVLGQLVDATVPDPTVALCVKGRKCTCVGAHKDLGVLHHFMPRFGFAGTYMLLHENSVISIWI